MRTCAGKPSVGDRVTKDEPSTYAILFVSQRPRCQTAAFGVQESAERPTVAVGIDESDDPRKLLRFARTGVVLDNFSFTLRPPLSGSRDFTLRYTSGAKSPA